MLVSILSWVLGTLALIAVLAVGCLVLATLWIAAKAERLVPPVGKFIEIDGNRIHYADIGQGRPIVFLHGLGAQLHHFRHTLFGRFGPGYRLIALDRPGAGYSVRTKGATGRLPEQAEIVRRFIEALDLEKPLVVGHSLGGAIALTLAVEHPEALGRSELHAGAVRQWKCGWVYGDSIGPLEIAGPIFEHGVAAARVLDHLEAARGGWPVRKMDIDEGGAGSHVD